MHEDNHINTVRALLIEQMRALRSAKPGEQLVAELERARGVSGVAQTIIASAKVEVEYLTATDQGDSPFLKTEEGPGTLRLEGPGNGISSITRHRMGG